MKQLAIAALAIVASAFTATSIQAQDNPPANTKIAPAVHQPVIVDLSKPLPKTIDITVGHSVIFKNGSSKTQAAETDTKGQLFKELNPGSYHTLRVGSGEITVTNGTQVDKIAVNVMYPVRPNKGPAFIKPIVPRPLAAVQVDLSKALPQKIQLVVGQKVVLVNDKAQVDAKETDGKGSLLKDVPHKQPNVDMYIFEATREGKGELKLAFPNTGLATKPRLETIPVEVVAPGPVLLPKVQPGKQMLPRPKAAVPVDLSKALPQKIQLTVGQKVVLFNDKAKVEAKETDGKGGLLKDVPHNKPNINFYVFEATREGKGEIQLTYPTQGMLQVITTKTIVVEVVAPQPAPAPKHQFKPLPRPMAAVQVDLSKALPQKIQLTVGQKVVLSKDKAKVDAKDTDGKGGLLKDVPHKLPNVDMYIFEATREGKGELTLAFPSTGLATKPRLETISVEVIAPPPAPAPKPRQQRPGNPAIKKSGVSGATIEGPIMGNPPVGPGARTGNFAPVANATVIFKDANNKEAGRATSDKNGKFSIDLPEGDYVVESEHPAKDKQSGLPRNYQGKVSVGKHGRAHCVIRYETGRP